jgi:hypothetical protein
MFVRQSLQSGVQPALCEGELHADFSCRDLDVFAMRMGLGTSHGHETGVVRKHEWRDVGLPEPYGWPGCHTDRETVPQAGPLCERQVGIPTLRRDRRAEPAPFRSVLLTQFPGRLELLVKLASRAGNKNPSGNAALAIFHSLHNTRGLAAFGTIRALGGVHLFLTIRCLRNLRCHSLISLRPYGLMSRVQLSSIPVPGA